MLARDRLGIKPMYFAALPGGGIAFGSESGALVRSGIVDAGPDTASILGYLMWGSVQGPRTILGGVQELQPGHYVCWDGSGHEERVWWEPAFDPRLDRDSSLERLRGALGDAVQKHLVADREVGLFLSGGVDSRAIAHTAAREGALRSLTVTFPEVRGDEGERAARVATELGFHHETVPVLGSELAAVLPTIAAAMDQPTADGVNSWVVSRAAHQAGLVVALSGVGGDELFGGYPSFKLVPRVAAAGKALHMLPHAARRAVADAIVSRRPVSPGSRVVMTGPGFGGAYRAVRGLFGLRDLEHLGALRWVGERDAIDLFTPASPRESSPGDAVALLELQRYLRNQLLRDTDVMSMAHSLEVRVPLLDDAVVQTALSIPAAIRNQPGKRLLQAAAGFSHAPPKEGFTLPFGSWMHGPLREPVRELVLSNDLPLGWLMTPDARRELWQAFEERRVHWSRPWAIGMLRLWADTHGYRW
jgi:asparagine synthase (glutamine-hydrolysing)